MNGTIVTTDALEVLFVKCATQIAIDKKRLTQSQRTGLERYLTYQKALDLIKKENIHLYRLIKNAYPVTTQKVITHDTEYFQLILNNGLKVKCDKRIRDLFVTDEETIHSNF